MKKSSENILADLNILDIDFSDLRKNLFLKIDNIKKESDLQIILKKINSLIKDKIHPSDQVQELKKIRQVAYDRKKYIKKVRSEISVKNKASGKRNQIFSFIIILTFLMITTVSISYLLYNQSLELYKSNQFSSPQLTSLGIILMAIGFPILHVLSKNWLTLFFCFYICSYEVYFMVSATIQNEDSKEKKMALESSKVSFMRENTLRTKEAYLMAKKRYDDPSSNVYQNHWFKKTQLNKRWDEHKKAIENLDEEETKIKKIKPIKSNTYAKILYRLGLFFFCMMTTHLFATKLKNYLGPF